MKDNYYLIGTAGHVDHGKSCLIRALTGQETDRLPQEKERGISIELGFTYLTLPGGKKIGIVDVPGHEKFVRQMLAGASGMDIVLMIVAADEGVMPQTLEHLAILELLNIKKGIVVINKTDLVDREWLALVEQDIREKFKGSFLENAPYCRVSSLTGDGLDNLLQTIIKLLDQAETRPIDYPARMPIDRVFTIQGFGTVVTGTLASGIFVKGQQAVVEPGHKPVKVRNIQVHGETVSEVCAGQRAAINLSNIESADVVRGSWLVVPGFFKVGQIVDVELTNLKSETRAIVQRQRIHFHIGTTEVLGRVHLLDREELLPGQRAFAQILLEEPVLAAPGDRFVIRFYSPVTTIGGGVVIEIVDRKKKRYRQEIMENLKIKAEASSEDLLLMHLNNPVSLAELSSITMLPEKTVREEISKLLSKGVIYSIKIDEIKMDESCLYWSKTAAEEWGAKAAAEIARYKQAHPLRRGIGRELLKRRLPLDVSLRAWQAVLKWGAENGYFRVIGNNVEPEHELKLPDDLRGQIVKLTNIWLEAGLNPPNLKEIAEQCALSPSEIQEYVDYLVEKKVLVKIGDYYFAAETIAKAQQDLKDLLLEKGRVTAAEARDYWKTSRRYAILILEYFDSIRFTKREGEARTLYPG